MFTLRKRFRFEAAHQLPHHDGKCKRLHGHSWQGVVEVEGMELHANHETFGTPGHEHVKPNPKAGMLVDFGDLSGLINGLVETKLDHYYLNESLAMESPTSELVAEYVFKTLAEAIGEGRFELRSVTIEETCTSSATYTGRELNERTSYGPKRIGRSDR